MAAVSKGGMDLRAALSDQFWAVSAATRILYDMLTGKGSARASRAAAWAHEFFETSLRRNPSEHRIECVKGCAHCCRVTVAALAPEIFLAANAVRAAHPQDFAAQFAAIRAAESATHGLSPLERGRRRLPCVLLKDNACTVYDARPGACRAAASASARACEIAFSGGNAGIPTPAVWTTLRNAGLQAMWAALVAAELPADQYEFNEAVTVALAIPDAEARWLNGENVFKGVVRIRIDHPAVVENNRKVIAQLVAGALGHEMPA